MFQLEHFKMAKFCVRKLLIPGAGFWVGQWIPGVRLRRNVYFRGPSCDYESGLDTGGRT